MRLINLPYIIQVNLWKNLDSILQHFQKTSVMGHFGIPALLEELVQLKILTGG